MEGFKQFIHIEGKCIDDIFFLPCIVSVDKIKDTYCYYLENGQCADIGDWLCEDQDGKWSVLSDEQYKRMML